MILHHPASEHFYNPIWIVVVPPTTLFVCSE